MKKPLEISALARRDLFDIQFQSLREYGHAHTRYYMDKLVDQFTIVSEFPKIVPSKKLGKRNVHVYNFEAHNIIYIVKRQAILIVRVLSRFQNWPDHI